jgi:predicted transcriptional regulator
MADTTQNEAAIDRSETLSLTTDIVAAFVSNNSVPAEQLQDLLQNTFQTLSNLSGVPKDEEVQQKPAVPVRKSITDDYLICLEDGKKLKMLKRYLRTQYNMSPEDYRRKWNLPADYPMVAPNYAKRRSEFAKQIGLGTQGGRKATAKRARRKTAQTAS